MFPMVSPLITFERIVLAFMTNIIPEEGNKVKKYFRPGEK
jgi:hypothetical protein